MYGNNLLKHLIKSATRERGGTPPIVLLNGGGPPEIVVALDILVFGGVPLPRVQYFVNLTKKPYHARIVCLFGKQLEGSAEGRDCESWS